MAVAKTAVVVGCEHRAGGTSLLRLRVSAEEAAAMRGGRYIIVNTGLELDDGRPLKRAYSLLDYDRDAGTVTLGIMALARASRYMAESPAGREYQYSGPWGKLNFPDSGSGRILFLASYTGITTLLALLRERGASGSGHEVDFVYYRPDQEYFLGDDYVRGLAEAHGIKVQFNDCPAAEHPEAEAFFDYEMKKLLTLDYQRALLTGDGRMIFAARADLLARGLPAEEILEECFLNKKR